ncbi:hypothetical protein GF339_17320 [candidate division KSB3 bacterium]|uniref:PNPLA domain-containing protein n=1 Tax=candidate division KSB3 bacterium TaxID=2044937 RepID=A0A9D5JXX9_9BACT|nr:hypothetical protein [candidate division KSB3 bacterium]MBD3326349.1 hypothetical protein [candidate division KSB3 bacterium]
MGQISLGVALGGGVARSLANIGVLNILAREQIRIDYLAGTSGASIIGAIYASGVSLQETNAIAIQAGWKDIASIAWWNPLRGIFSSEPIAQFLEKHCRCKYFEELQIPFGVVAADLMSGEERLFTSGEISPAVRASCSIPGVFQPVLIGKRLYIDGCYVNQIPASAVRQMGADVVVGCDVSRGALAVSKRVPRNMLTLLRHLVALHSQKTADKGRLESDLVIPIKVNDIGLTELVRGAEIIARGEQATEDALPLLKEMLREGRGNRCSGA